MGILYFKRLDALRFFAFFLVFWNHTLNNYIRHYFNLGETYMEALFDTGESGVRIFFVISGFLITYLLLKEYKANDEINIKHFYYRRLLRIWPLYYLVLIPSIYIFPQFISTMEFCGSELLNLTFLNNFDNPPCHTPNVRIAWSVAIEEQFYLFWPLVFAGLIKKPKILIATCTLISIFSSIYIVETDWNSRFDTLGNLNYLMTGCIGAIVYSENSEVISQHLSKTKFIYPVILTILLLHTYKPDVSAFLMPLGYLYVIVYLIVNDTKGQSIFSKLGKYTYGMYMYHPLLVKFTKISLDILDIDYRTYAPGLVTLILISFVLTIIVSIISYQYFEKWFINLKKRFTIISTRT